jgi:hypothetical protein
MPDTNPPFRPAVKMSPTKPSVQPERILKVAIVLELENVASQP